MNGTKIYTFKAEDSEIVAAPLLYWSEFNQFFIVLHQMNLRFEVSIQRFFTLYVNHHALIIFYIDKSRFKVLV